MASKIAELAYGQRVIVTLGSSKTGDLRTLEGVFTSLHTRSLTATHGVLEARVQTPEGEVLSSRVEAVLPRYRRMPAAAGRFCVWDRSAAGAVRDAADVIMTYPAAGIDGTVDAMNRWDDAQKRPSNRFEARFYAGADVWVVFDHQSRGNVIADDGTMVRIVREAPAMKAARQMNARTGWTN
jgi:hypothetical protein